MKRKILGILVCMLLCVTASAVTGTEIVDENKVITDVYLKQTLNRDPWDLLFNLDLGEQTGGVSRAGCEFDGTYFYSTVWNANLIDKYDIEGNLIETFSIPGVSQLRDLAWDGTYMYGGAAGGTIYEMDFVNKELISSISGSFACRAIAYDSDLDVFYVSDWSDPVWIVERSGTVSGQINLVTTTSTYGFAYDNICDSRGPYLWVFDQGGSGAEIHQWDLAAEEYTGFIKNVEDEVGSGDGIAGGLFTADDYQQGIAIIGGIYQDGDSALNTDWLFGYELCITNEPPETPGPPSGPDEGVVDEGYTFSAVTTDPDGDKIRYMFDWGDGTFSDWSAAVNSGTPVEKSHSWEEPGDYEVKVKAIDVNDAETDWSDAHTITIITLPELEIGAIWGGLFKVSAKIRNIGDADATGVEWSINLDGGIILTGGSTTGAVDIPAGETVTVQSDLIIGIGSTTITVKATIPESSDTRSKKAFVLLIFIQV